MLTHYEIYLFLPLAGAFREASVMYSTSGHGTSAVRGIKKLNTGSHT